jgi:hypothetical protein
MYVMMTFGVVLQACHLVVWMIVLAGSIVFLRRGYAIAAVSTLLGACIALLMGALNLFLMTWPFMFRWARQYRADASRFMMVVGLASAVGMFLFALGFWQLARTTRREG